MRRAINVIKDRIAGTGLADSGSSAATCLLLSRILKSAACSCVERLSRPNAGDSFRTLLEQVLEDALGRRLWSD